VPLHVTGGPRVQPATFRETALMGMPSAWRSAIASGMLLAQSPVAMKVQVICPGGGVGKETIDGVLIENEFPTV
jgi:hypothetical protein